MESTELEDDGIGAALRQAVATYCNEWRNPNRPTFQVYRHTYATWHKVPEAAGPGCYATYDASGRLLYVGKASLNSEIGRRLWHHFEKGKPAWAATVLHIFFVQVTQAFEAPSLEEYLIQELQPAHNSLGIARPESISVPPKSH